MTHSIKQVTIIGTGLIGGSLALALREHRIGERIVGCDRPEVLEKAITLGVIDAAQEDPWLACDGSDVVVLATPVGAIADLVTKLGAVLPPQTLITDVGSTKRLVMERAHAVFGDAVHRRFLGGHPMAGREVGGVEHADSGLFRGCVWLLTPSPGQRLTSGITLTWVRAISEIGARVIEMDADRHDRLVAWISHLPQFLSTTFAAAVDEEFGADPDVHAIGGRALQEMTRLARSPYSMWRDIAITNEKNIQEALLQMEQRLAHLRENLNTRELEQEFEKAKQFQIRKR